MWSPTALNQSLRNSKGCFSGLRKHLILLTPLTPLFTRQSDGSKAHWPDEVLASITLTPPLSHKYWLFPLVWFQLSKYYLRKCVINHPASILLIIKARAPSIHRTQWTKSWRFLPLGPSTSTVTHKVFILFPWLAFFMCAVCLFYILISPKWTLHFYIKCDWTSLLKGGRSIGTSVQVSCIILICYISDI